MSKTDWAVVALSAFALCFAVVGVMDPATWGNIPLLWAMLALTVNGGWIIRRGARDQRQPQRGEVVSNDVTLDARQLLEIDERLEMLERRDTQRIPELVSWGEIHEPAVIPDQLARPRDRA